MTSLRTLLALVAALAASLPALRAEEAAAPGPVPLTAGTLLAALGRDLKSHYNLEGELDLQLTRPWTPPSPAPADWTLAVLDYPATPSSSMLVRCQIRGAADPVDFQLVLRANLWRDAWVVRLPLTVGLVFDPSRLDVRRTDLLRERDVVPAAAGDRNYIFCRAVPVGRMLTWHDLARHPLVHKGELVEVTAVDGELSISMKALAMENGAQGDTVTVRNTDSHKEFPAIVTDENRVQVQF